MLFSIMKENFVRIREGVYIVRTQAGYSKAVKMEWGTPTNRRKSYLNSTPFPDSYPALVIMASFYAGGLNRMNLICFPINQLKEVVERIENPRDINND